jgi:predicted nucleic acid-binding protein
VRTAVDTSVLLDLLAGDKAAIEAGRSALIDALGRGTAVTCPVVYAELAGSFLDPDTVNRFLDTLQLQLDQFSREALVQAAVGWRRYVRSRARETQCSRCGHRAEFQCPDCGAPISWRQHIIPEFLVGGHAAVQADRLLTRDPHYYRRYFPTVAIISP